MRDEFPSLTVTQLGNSVRTGHGSLGYQLSAKAKAEPEAEPMLKPQPQPQLEPEPEQPAAQG